MPKGFSGSERLHIKEQLSDAAKSCLARYGVKKTTVDELARLASIPKGTFYLFYDSKELLFYDVLCEFHNRLHEKLLENAAALRESLTPQSLTKLLFDLYKTLDKSFLLPFLDRGEMDLFLRKLPPEIAKEHILKDNFDLEKLLVSVSLISEADVKTMSAALRAIFMTILYKREIGEEIYDDALKVLLYGIALQLIPETKK